MIETDFTVKPSRVLVGMSLISAIVLIGLFFFGFYVDPDHSDLSDSTKTKLVLILYFLVTFLPPSLMIYYYYNWRIRVVGDNIYYQLLLRKEKCINIQDIERAEVKIDRRENTPKLKVYVNSKGIFTVPGNCEGYNLLVNRLKDANVKIIDLSK